MARHPDVLSLVQPAVAEWFRASFEAPTPPQTQGWPAIAQGDSTLILAPTGSGKTLTAFLWCINRVMFDPVPPKAHRWVPEMHEIAKTFEGVGMTPRILLGAADMYKMIAETPLGRESPEAARDKARKGPEVIRGLADGTS